RSVHLLPPLRSPLFPYTTLFRSWGPAADAVAGHREVAPLARLLAIEVLARPLRQVGVAGALDHGEVEVAAEGGDMQACESRALVDLCEGPRVPGIPLAIEVPCHDGLLASRGNIGPVHLVECEEQGDRPEGYEAFTKDADRVQLPAVLTVAHAHYVTR